MVQLKKKEIRKEEKKELMKRMSKPTHETNQRVKKNQWSVFS